MAQYTVLWVLGGDDAADELAHQADGLLGDPALAAATATRVAADDLIAAPKSHLRGVCAAWLLGVDDDQQYEAFAALREAGVPTMVTRAGQDTLGPSDDEGLVNCPADTPHAVAAAVLATLLVQSPVLSAQAAESRALAATTRGMAGQFDKIDEELRMAVKIQREFLPKTLPTPGGFNFGTLWRPAGYVGGDIYDVVELDDEHLGVFIADAVGHGVPAALMTIFIKQATPLREITPGVGPGYRVVPPGEALAALNVAMIEQDAGAASLGTAAYGVIHRPTRTLRYASAGHPAAALLRQTGGTEWLDPEGAMLGVFPDEVYSEAVVELHPQDRLLMYSDGFEVAFPNGEGKGRLANEQYAQEFESMRGLTPDDALAFLQGRLDLQAGSLNQRDDLTVVLTTCLEHADAEIPPACAA